MDRLRATGLALSFASLLAYGAGILGPYPGRELSVPGMMVGVTLLGIGSSGRTGSSDGNAEGGT